MTVKSAMNDCSPQNHSALWSPCCRGTGSTGSSYDDQSGRPQLPDRPPNSDVADPRSRPRLCRPQLSPSAGRRQPAANCCCRRCQANVDVTAEQFLRPRRPRPPEIAATAAARRTLPRPAQACTTRQPAVVSHTVHSREIDKPLPQMAVAPPPSTSSVLPRSAPLHRRHIPDVHGSSSSKATQTTDAALQSWKHQTAFDELLRTSGSGNVDRESDDDDDDVAFLPRLCRPSSAPRMSAGSSAFNVRNRTACLPPATSCSSEAALVDELAARGRHAASLERFADATADVAGGAFQLLSRFQSATFPALSHVDVEVDDEDGDGERRPPGTGTNDFRSGNDRDAYVVSAAGSAYAPSDEVVRWTTEETKRVDGSLNVGKRVPEENENDLFIRELLNNSDDDCASDLSRTSSAFGCPPLNDARAYGVGSLLARSSGRPMTSTPMTGLPACSGRVVPRNEDLPQHGDLQKQVSWSPSDVDVYEDEDDDGKRSCECNAETARPASSCCDDADVAVDASTPDGCAQDGPQRRRRVVMYYPPQAFKFYIEQHMENVMKAYEERRRHRDQLEDEMERLGLPDDARTQMRRMLFQKESYHNRLRRTRMDRRAFRPIAVLGRGAFADVLLVRKRDSGALYAMKRLRKSDVLRNRQAAHVKAERDILAEADNEWIVRLSYSFQALTCFLQS